MAFVKRFKVGKLRSTLSRESTLKVSALEKFAKKLFRSNVIKWFWEPLKIRSDVGTYFWIFSSIDTFKRTSTFFIKKFSIRLKISSLTVNMVLWPADVWFLIHMLFCTLYISKYWPKLSNWCDIQGVSA